MSDEVDEMSAASRGSHGPVSVSVHVDKSACGLPDSRPLRRTIPTLTDEEREAIEWAIAVTARTYDDHDGGPIKREALRGILKRLG